MQLNSTNSNSRDQNHFATFVLSTGRCGTQWLHHIFQKYYSSEIHCEHEPLGHDYNTRFHLHHPSAEAYYRNAPEKVRGHIDFIKNTLLKSDYIEVGHTCWGSLKYFAEIFKGRMRVIWLTRHPVALAKSWSTHGLYLPVFLPHQKEKIFIHPADRGALFPQFREHWHIMSQLDKIVYYWLEVNARIEDLMGLEYLSIHHISFESLFMAGTMSELVSFLGLQYSKEIEDDFQDRVDHFRYDPPVHDGDISILKDGEVKALSSRLNYTLD